MPINNKKYQENLLKAMEMLAKEKDTIFIGETVEYPGSAMFGSLANVPAKKKMEMPVFENTQMGISIGLALEGFIPISIFPRIDFLICAIDQLVNHLDKIQEMSQGEFSPGIIIRTQIGSDYPINGGPQHTGDYTMALKKLCKNIHVIKITKEDDVIYLSIKNENFRKKNPPHIFLISNNN